MNIPDQKVEKIEEQQQESSNFLEDLLSKVDKSTRIIIAVIIVASIYLYSVGTLDGQTILLYLAAIYLFLFLFKSQKTTRLLDEDECKALLLEKLNYKQTYTTEIPSGEIKTNLPTVQRAYNQVLDYRREISFSILGNYVPAKDYVCIFDSRFPGKVVSIIQKRFGYCGDESPDIIMGWNLNKIDTRKYKDIAENNPEIKEVLGW